MSNLARPGNLISTDPLVVSDEAELDLAIAAINSSGGGILKFSGDISITSEKVFNTSNIVLTQERGARIIPEYDAAGFSQAGNNEALFRFESLVAPALLDAPMSGVTIAPNATSVTLTAAVASLVDVDDWLAFVTGLADPRVDAATGAVYGETRRVIAKDGNDIQVDTPFISGVPTPTSVSVYKVSTLKNIIVEGLIIDNGGRATVDDEHYCQLITFKGVESSRVAGVYSPVGSPGGFVLENCFSIDLVDNKIDRMSHRIVGGRYVANQNYGIVINGYGHGIDVVNNKFFDVRHGFTTGSGVNGHPTSIRVIGGEYHTIGAACLDTHAPGHVLFDGVTASMTSLLVADTARENNGTGGKVVQIRSPETIVRDCQLRGNNWVCQSQSDDVAFVENDIWGTGSITPSTSFGVGFSSKGAVAPERCRAIRNRIHRSGANGIAMLASIDAVVDGNEFRETNREEAGSQGHILIGTASGAHIINNTFYLSSAHNYSLRDNRGAPAAAPAMINRFYNNQFIGFPAPDANKGVVNDGVRFEDTDARATVIQESGNMVDGTVSHPFTQFTPEIFIDEETSITFDAVRHQGVHYKMPESAGGTINNPAAGSVPVGPLYHWRITQSGTVAQELTWGTAFIWVDDVTPVFANIGLGKSVDVVFKGIAGNKLRSRLISGEYS
jgi:hypothetical protein